MYNAIVFFEHFGATALYYNMNRIVCYNLGNYIFLKNSVTFVIYILIKKVD
jgi:hypothetical protein